MKWKYPKSKSFIAASLYQQIAREHRALTYGEMEAVLKFMLKKLRRRIKKEGAKRYIFSQGDNTPGAENQISS